MSKVELKQSFKMDPLDADVLKVLIERFNADKLNFDKANDRLVASQGTFLDYMDRMTLPLGVDKTEYRPNFLTGQLEPIPTVAPVVRQVTTAPDSNEPPAPPKLEPDPV